MATNDKDWSQHGMNNINTQINRRPLLAKANYSSNQIFYGKKNDKYSVNNILGYGTEKMAQTEAELEAAST